MSAVRVDVGGILYRTASVMTLKMESGLRFRPPSECGRYKRAVLADFASPDHLFRYTVTSESTCRYRYLTCVKYLCIQVEGNSWISSGQVRLGHTLPE